MFSDEENEGDEEEESELKKLYPETYKTKERRLLRGEHCDYFYQIHPLKKIIFFQFPQQQTHIRTLMTKKKMIMIIAPKMMTTKK